MGGKVVKLDGAKKGRQDWETELQRPPVSPPSFLPIMTKLSVLDDQGAIQTVDAKSGKPLWRYNIESQSRLKETWSARLKGMVIQETSMNWAYRGWSIWAPCSKNRLCIYNPDKGQLINRITVSGSLLSFPYRSRPNTLFPDRPRTEVGDFKAGSRKKGSRRSADLGQPSENAGKSR